MRAIRITSPGALLAISTLVAALTACERQPPEPKSDATEPPAVAAVLRTRAAVHAGSWYPAEAAALRAAIDERLDAAIIERRPKAIIGAIGPHAGLRFSGSVAADLYAALRTQEVERVILLGPSHRVPFHGIALPAADLAAYATPLGDLAIDRDMVDGLRRLSGFDGPSRAHDAEHALEMHAIFIKAIAPEAKIVPLLIGRLGADLGGAAQRLRGRLAASDVVIASTDFTHYGPRYDYTPATDDVPTKLRQLLTGAMSALVDGDRNAFETHLNATGDTICGQEPVRLLLAMLPEDFMAEKMADDTSGRMLDDYSNSVTYLALAYRRLGGWGEGAPVEAPQVAGVAPEVLDDVGQQKALELARTSLDLFFRNGRVPELAELDVPHADPWHDNYGAFVTLKKKGKLRGCIGHIFPVVPLWKSIRDNAIAAAVKDKRFAPVGLRELGELQLEVSVLTPPTRIPASEAFEVGQHGIVLSAFGRRAVFLPQVAPEQGWDRETTLTHLARKAGLPLDVWRRPEAQFEVFQAQVFEEPHASH